MDTKKLKVGQYVRFRSGIYSGSGTVIKVTPDGEVDVQTGVRLVDGTWNACEVEHFHNNGRGWIGEGTYENGPWELVEEEFDEPFPKRKGEH